MSDVTSIKDSYKKQGLLALKQHNYTEAIQYFNEWQYVYPKTLGLDTYTYDYDILNGIDIELSNFRYTHYKTNNNNKICVAYLSHGMLSSTSIVPKILINLIKYHDKSKFDIHVFTTDNWFDIYRSSGSIFIKQFKDAGCTLHYAPFFKNGFSKVESIAKKIYMVKPNILVTTAALSDFIHYCIANLKPAPFNVGFVLGCPSQFISSSFDYGISWFDRIINDCPVPCLNSGQIFISDSNIESVSLSRKDYEIPDNAIVIMSAGRYTKFQNTRVLNILANLMIELPNLHYLIIGLDPNQTQVFSNLSDDIKDRIHVFRWSESYKNYFSLADIYLDTFPSGGGMTLYDAASFYLPIISFTDSVSKSFDQSDWNPAQDLFLSNSITLIDRNNLDDIKSVICNFYYNQSDRVKMGMAAYQNMIYNNYQTKKNIIAIENLYTQLVTGDKK